MTPHRLVARTGDGVHLTVRHFPARKDRAPAVLVVHGFAQNHRAFDVPGRSLAHHLAEHGVHVFLGELRGRHASHRGAATLPHGFRHYVDEDAPAMLEAVTRHLGQERVMVLGHSMGGLICAALPERAARHVAARILLCPPYRFLDWLTVARRPLALWMRAVRAGLPLRLPTRMVGPALAAGRALLDLPLPTPLAVWAPGSVEPDMLEWALHHSFAWEAWRVLADLLELGATHGERAGRVPVGDRVRALEGPLLVLAANRDGLAPPRTVEPLYRAAGSREKEYRVLGRELRRGMGHLDAVMGKHAPAHVWPVLREFLRRVQ
ncbi:MAG: alpha/beta fold hydrolase [Deltaproteobacteria bacterium]|nr:alpha/beta fold hydrolase [Deltaproteobacteria bacterium]